MKRLDEITIADLMPDSISRDAQVSATSRAIDPQLGLISEAVDRPLILPAIDDLSAGVLEHLAVQYDVTAWDSAWPIETKRAVLKTAIADKRKKGTRGAVQRAIEAVAPIATITEWWQDPDGDMPPHTFKIELLQEESAVDPETQASVIAQVEEVKPVRSHYTFKVGQLLGGDMYFAGVLRAISYARVRSAGTTVEQTNIQAGVCAALRGMSIRRLLASSHMGDMPEPVVDVALLGGDFSGNNIRMESVDGGGGLIEKFASYHALFNLRGWEPGGLFIDKPRMMGICGVLTETSDSVVLVEVPKQLSVGRIEFTGSLAEGGIPESGVVEEYDPRPSIEINLGVRFDPSNAQWLAKTFDADEWWWSGILSSSDLSAIGLFGSGYLPTNNASYAFAGNIGALKYEGEKYEYRLISMFSDVGSSPISFDRSNFFFKRHYTDGNSSQYNGALLINSINAFATAVKSYRIKIIDKDPGAIYVLVGFKYSNGSWIQVTFAGVDDYFWAGILYADDQAKLQSLGLISDTSYPHDEILYSNAYNYECVAMYSDMGVTSVQFDPSNFYVDKATSYPCISIFSRAAFSTPVMTWVCRITRKTAPALYLPSGNLYEQSGVTSATNQIEKASSNETVHQLYTDPSRAIQFLPDLTKKYELGRYNNDQWEPFINEIDDMPESTVSSNSVNGYIILNSGLLWLCNNSSGDVYSQYPNGILFKEYPDEREWTTQTLYLTTGNKYYQLNSTCYTSPVPSSGTYQLYTDSSKTQPFYYDLDKEYRGGYINSGSFVVYREQRVWDLTPSTTSSSSERILATILTKTGKLWFVTNSTLTVYDTDTTFAIQSTQKQYDEPTITLDLGLRNDFTGATFSADDYWFSVLRNTLDKQKAIDFGISIGSRDRIADSILDGFNLELVALCDSYENTVITDMSNFYAGTQDGALVIRSINAFSTSTNYWRVRITRKPAPVLPTVETNLSAYGTVRSGTKSLAPNDIGVLYLRNASTTSVIYDDNYLYSVYRYYYDVLGASEWRTGAFFEAVKDGAALAAKNITNSTISYIGLYTYATCSDTQAEVVTVLNSSDEAFNAFKFTANNTDYYYVLDNTQTDWTDDLSSIGYHLPPVNLIGYMTEGKAAVTVRTGSPRKLYDSSGNLIPFDSTLQYTMICYYSYDGGDPLDKPAQMGFTNVEGSLGLFATNSRSFTVQRVEYTVS